ncbi:beta-glucosidase [Kribbella speibonae]|uniref:PA14 domain-containing protein n=1 Tax=Kribbella speibonae TaxID=1572660 RepID=A0A4R0IRI9_9ACTN|nr:glycoside hydrolase family 3 C-terminal domain-containing protein [Kribbella speibonae]TCC36403.1 hypothetical protein E0H92_27585 [Kribbella speibonae]
MPALAAGDPWRDTTKSPAERAKALLGALSFDEKVQIALDNFGSLTKYGLPETLKSHDGPSGISVNGATAFPAAVSLAASFDRGLAHRYGTAIAEETRANGSSIWLGPATDIARQPLSGRLAENLGEDPYLVGTTARAEVDGAKSRNVMTTVKHFGANVQEYARMGFQGEATDWPAVLQYCTGPGVRTPVPLGFRTPAINENIPAQALHEIYESPAVAAVEGNGADSVMCSYNQVNGLPACQNPDLLGGLKSHFNGLVIPDFLTAQRDAVAAALAGTDIAGFDNGNQQRTAAMYVSGQIPETVLNDSDYRILYALFASGVFDNPPTATTPISTDAHVQLAAEVAAQGMVLLKNQNNVLPLRTDRPVDRSIAVIGPSGTDAVYTEGGLGPSVPVSAETTVTPLEGIQSRAGAATTVTQSQGSAGDLAATTLVSGPWTAKFWNSAEPQGEPVLTRTDSTIDFTGPLPSALTTPFSATWTATVTPPETGTYRFTTLVSGDMTLAVNGKTVIDAMKPTSNCGGSRDYPAQGTVALRAGEPVQLKVDYSSLSNTICVASNNINLAWQTPSQSQIPAAVEAAKRANAAIVFANAASGEGSDRNTLELPGDQNQLIEAVSSVNKRTIVVLNTAGPVLMPWLDKVAGVVEAWYPGQTFGTALAKVLYGDVNPSGHLPMTFPATAHQGPVAATPEGLVGDATGSLNFNEGIYVGYRWYDEMKHIPLFPFGYGLSYTSFRYSNLKVRPDTSGATVSVLVSNVGTNTGTATPQFYIGAPTGSYSAQFAKHALAAYDKVTLKSGESATVRVHVDSHQLNYWDTASDSWRTATDGRTISVGDSVRQISATVPLSIR